MVIADLGLSELLWSLLVIFFMVMYFLIVFQVIGDIVRRDMSGAKKAGWMIGILLFPFIAMLAYLIANGTQMTERNVAAAKRNQEQFDGYIQSVAGGPAQEIATANELLASGAINEAEFAQIKARALSN